MDRFKQGLIPSMNDLGCLEGCTTHYNRLMEEMHLRFMSEEYDYDFIQASLKTQEDT
jgi:hypothetical protein